ncbi:L-asparaginase [Staphylococcus succinus]|uniref:asparaginase n=1 Tax=Staphylococcus succinus TaxID=61015 RepID=UPI000C3391A9|nr:asparaginase [Staphylococcus succinus]PKI22787.1 L-asparaginase [Staphylococcus succinus]
MAQKKKHIEIIATGGTIAGSGNSPTTITGYTPGSKDIKEILKDIPSVIEKNKISYQQLFNIDSVDMTNELMIQLAKHIQKRLDAESIDGIVVTLGTDTLEEVGYFLHLVLNTNKPVVLVGAIRPATAIGTDGLINLYQAINVASDNDSVNKGVLVVMNARILSARYVTKVNTTMTDAFQSLEAGAIGNIVGEKIYYFYNRPSFKHTNETMFNIDDITQLPKVNIVIAHQGDDAFQIKETINRKYEGLILATAGGYTISNKITEYLKNVEISNIKIVRTSRLGHGITTKTHLENKYNFIASETLNANKSRILLMLLIAYKIQDEELQNYFNQY